MKVKLDTATYTKSKLGIKAVVDLVIDGKKVFRDEIKLWQADSRNKFAKRCKAVEPKVSTDDISAKLIGIEKRIKAMEIADEIDKEDTRIRAEAGQSTAEPSMSKEGRDEATNLLRDPALLFKAGKTLEGLGLVGETRNALIIYLVLTSRLLRRIISTVIKAESY